MCNSVSLYLSNCFALSWPGRNCKWELVLNLPTWLNKGEINKNKPGSQTLFDLCDLCPDRLLGKLQGGRTSAHPLEETGQHNIISIPQTVAESNIRLCPSTTGLSHTVSLDWWDGELCNILFLIVCCFCIMYAASVYLVTCKHVKGLFICIYSGENKCLTHCRFCRFSYLQSM